MQILEVVRIGVDKGPVAGYEAEAQGFGELAMTPQSKGLIGLFRGQTECKKNRFGKSQVDVKTVWSDFSLMLTINNINFLYFADKQYSWSNKDDDGK